MPMDFPDESLERTAGVWKFRKRVAGENLDDYRKALHEHVRPKDHIESFEILFGIGWDQWSPEQKAKSLGGLF